MRRQLSRKVCSETELFLGDSRQKSKQNAVAFAHVHEDFAKLSLGEELSGSSLSRSRALMTYSQSLVRNVVGLRENNNRILRSHEDTLRA